MREYELLKQSWSDRLDCGLLVHNITRNVCRYQIPIIITKSH